MRSCILAVVGLIGTLLIIGVAITPAGTQPLDFGGAGLTTVAWFAAFTVAACLAYLGRSRNR